MKCLTPITLAGSGMLVPCGRCFNCSVNYSRTWALRMLHESKLHEQNCMFTLTYAETDGMLHKDHIQKFFKRLRKRIEPVKIRYYLSGEYGGKGGRPHYHCVLFGWIPPDIEQVKHTKYYSSRLLADIWGYGFVSIEELQYENLIYVAKYLNKIDPRKWEVPPFSLMSRKPGIGHDFVNPDMLSLSLIYENGKKYGLPKYYINVLEKQGYNIGVLKLRRQEIAKNIAGEFIEPYVFEEGRKQNEIKIKNLLKDKFFKKST